MNSYWRAARTTPPGPCGVAESPKTVAGTATGGRGSQHPSNCDGKAPSGVSLHLNGAALMAWLLCQLADTVRRLLPSNATLARCCLQREVDVHLVAYQLPDAPILCIAGCCTVVQHLEDVQRKVRDQPVVVRTEIQARQIGDSTKPVCNRLSVHTKLLRRCFV